MPAQLYSMTSSSNPSQWKLRRRETYDKERQLLHDTSKTTVGFAKQHNAKWNKLLD
jgi:hypothetical protein